MAQRPVFLPQAIGPVLVRTVHVNFEWHAGLSLSQKQKSIASLHAAAHRLPGVCRVLEVSSKSPEPLGVALSAFNLTIAAPANIPSPSVECAFQGSKVFERGGPFTDLLEKSSRQAKQDPRLQASGRLTGFHFDGVDWPLEPPTVFYDWIYILALQHSDGLLPAAAVYDGFTDIEFNPARSINCQAYALALATALHRRGILHQATASREAFIRCVQDSKLSSTYRDDFVQGSLL